MNHRQKSIEKSMQEIFDRADARKETGRDSFNVDWQATLEIKLLGMERPLLEHPGQMLPIQIDDQEEWEFYLDIQEKLDLPPETCAVLITPSAFKDMPTPEEIELKTNGLAPWERNAYSIIISSLYDHTVVMQASLPGLESVGIDVFEDGHHLANYTYNTIDECLNDLGKVIWIHLNSIGEWTEELITRYTENWFAKGIDIDLDNVIVHEEYNYVHHPELLNLTPLGSVFKVIEATVPKEYDTLEKAIEITNDINRDMDLGEAIVTEEGILQDDPDECQELFNRITVEIDMKLEIMDNLEGVKMPDRSIKNIGYNRAFDETARKIYKKITGRPCPALVQLV